MTIFDVQSGDIAIGSSGARCEVLRVEGDYVAIAHPKGEKRIAINNVSRFERPYFVFKVGDRVGKLNKLGWWGRIHSPSQNETVDVLWDYETHPTLESIFNLYIRKI